LILTYILTICTAMSLDTLVSFAQTTDGASSNLIFSNDLQMIWTHRQIK
jgi:hypothetical protein